MFKFGKTAMRRIIMTVCAIFCLLCLTLEGYEVTTMPQTVEVKSDRAHYPILAKRFSDTLKMHPPVSDCHLLLHTTTIADYVERIEIAIQIDRQALIAYLTEEHNIRFVTPRDQDRYLDSFANTIRTTASEIFTEVKHESINVSLTYSD
jgi:hypothetical protein